MTFWKWSQTASGNDTADPTVNLREGMAPSVVNDSVRALMAAAAKFRDDISGSVVTTGTSSAYAISTNQNLTSLTDGFEIAFRPHTGNAAGVTLAVDSNGAKPLRSATGVAIGAGVLVQGTPYRATYFSAADEWVLHEFFGNPYNVPVGGFLPFISATPPNSNFVLPYGQAVSRTTYSALYALCGTTFGTGDGSTTFNLPDLRGRVIVGKDDMGGSAANRVTSAVSSIDGTAIGAAGGSQKMTIARANLPNTTLGLTGTTNDPGNHGHPYRVSSGDDGQTHGGFSTNDFNGTNQPAYTGALDNTWGHQIGGAGAHTHSVTGTTENLNGGVTQTDTNNMPPAIVLPMLLRII